jgi:hypothetical protein
LFIRIWLDDKGELYVDVNGMAVSSNNYFDGEGNEWNVLKAMNKEYSWRAYICMYRIVGGEIIFAPYSAES